MHREKKIVILGAGISGLTTAYLLDKAGCNVTVIEKKADAGGSMESIAEKGFLFDRGPNSALETTPLIAQLVEELGLKKEFLYASKDADKRYILRGGKLHALPMSPPAFLKTKLFSVRAKLRLLAEPFVGRSNDGYYQSVADFVKRRLGREFLDYAINPFVAGVYAGNPEELSVKSAFPKLYDLEEKYGGLIIGTIKSIKERKRRAEKSKQSAKMFSFEKGMQSLPLKIASKLQEKILLFSEVKSIEKKNNGFKVYYNNAGSEKSIDCDVLISTIPAYSAADLFGVFDQNIEKHLREIYYPSVLVLFVGYDKKLIKRPLDGFGFLIPSKEKKSFLGAIWSSVLFPNRADDNLAAFTLFVGGSRNPEILSYDKELLFKKAIDEFKSIMDISGEPVYSSYRFWSKAIPQYNLGYIEHEKAFDEFEKKNPGIFLSGNYRGGISVADCIKTADEVSRKVMGFMES